MRVHVCVPVIKGLPYEDTSCESRNTQQDLSLLSERDTQKTETGERRESKKCRGRNKYDSELETQRGNTETNRHVETCRHRKM